METFLATIFAFPTLVFSLGLIVSVVYWLFVILGALDLDIGGDADMDLGDAGDAGDAGEAGGEGDVGEAGALAALLSVFSLRKAPITISLSILFFVGWVISYYASLHLLPVIPGPEILAKVAILLGTLFLATPIASAVSRPIGKLFASNKAPSKRELVGRVARVRVHADVGQKGQATLDDSSGSLLRVRSSDAALANNAKVLLIDYDAESDTFEVEAMDEILGDTKKR